MSPTKIQTSLQRGDQKRGMEWIFRLLAAVVVLCLTEGTSVGSNYKAAVFEHRHRHDNTHSPKEVIQVNLRFYEKAAKIAAEKGVDLLLFNEFGLFDFIDDRNGTRPYMETVPDPKTSKHNPCLEKEKTFKDRTILPTLSCLARQHQMYIVANMGDIHPCDAESQTCDADDGTKCGSANKKCPSDGVFMYNTNVVFDRAGNLIARYHKVHPYFEIVNVPEADEFSYFETSFGRFGLIICFDSMFKEAVVLAKDIGIDTMIFPTLWFDKIAPLNAVELQQSWALANKVNFLAANGHEPGAGTLGSGIYSKDSGALVYSYNPDGESKLLVAHLSGKKSDAELIVVREEGSSAEVETGDGFPEQCDEAIVGPAKDPRADYRCQKRQVENHNLVKLEKAKGHVTSCDNDFCCSLSYSADDMTEDYYLAVRNFTNDADKFYHWCEETCILVRCDPFEGKPCLLFPPTSKTVFRSFKMSAHFTAERVYAAVSKDKNRLAPTHEWKQKVKHGYSELKFKTESDDSLLKAVLFGRCYHRDPPFTPWYTY